MKVIYCSSIDHIKKILKDNSGKNVAIRTSSFFVNKENMSPGISLIDDKICTEKFNKIRGLLYEMSLALYDFCISIDCSHSEAIAISVSMAQLHSVFYFALSLDSTDFLEERIVFGCAQDMIEDAFGLHEICQLLSHGENFTYYALPAEKGDKSRKNPNLLRRVLSYSFTYIFMKLMQRLSWVFRKNGLFLIDNDNPAISDTSYYFFKKFFAVKKLVKVVISKEKVEYKFPKEAALFLRNYLEKNFSCVYDVKTLDVLFMIVIKKTFDRYIIFKKRVEVYRHSLQQYSKYPIKAVLTNMPSPALYAASEEVGVPVVGFQHGHSREIVLDYGLRNNVFKEQQNCTYLMNYNAASAECSVIIPCEIAEAFPVGLPKFYRKKSIGKIIPPYRKYQFLYVSTLVMGNKHLIDSYAVSSSEKIKREARLIDDVFSVLSEKVLYKPYPDSCLQDMEYLMQYCMKTPNVIYDQRFIDLRFLFSSVDILITSRATSTLGWCLFSGLPVIFINYDDDCCLKPSLANIFKESIFYFEYSDDDFYIKLNRFLSQPVKKIFQEWNNKIEKRKKLLKYFSFDGFHAGSNSARVILEKIGCAT